MVLRFCAEILKANEGGKECGAERESLSSNFGDASPFDANGIILSTVFFVFNFIPPALLLSKYAIPIDILGLSKRK